MYLEMVFLAKHDTHQGRYPGKSIPDFGQECKRGKEESGA